MRRSVGFSPSIDKDMDDQEAESLIRQVRILRNGGFEPILYLFRDEFEQLADFWSCFYTTPRATVLQDGKLVIWLKRLFRVKVKEKLIFYQISDDALARFRAEISEKMAIPIDGCWTDIIVVREAEAHGDNS